MNKQRFSRKGMIFLFILPLLFFLTGNVYAVSDDEIMAVLANNKDFFVTNSISSDVFRWLGWSLVKLLNKLAGVGENLYRKAFELLTFSTGTSFEEWLDTFEPLFIGLLAVSLVVLGIILIFNHEKKPNVINNICMMIAVITCSFMVMSQLNGLIKTGVNVIVDESPSLSAINDSFYDLYYIDVKKGGLDHMKESNYGNYHYDHLTDKEMELIDINEVLNPNKDGLTDAGSEILSKQLDVVSKSSESGKNQLSEVYNGFGWNSQDDNDWFNEFYYRYKVDYLSACIALMAYIIVYFSMAYKVVRIIFELAAHRVLAVLYSADLTGGQKTMKILASIKDSYIVMLFSAIMIKLFTMMNTYISGKFPDDALVRNIFILFIAFAVCDGPNIIEKLTGIDAGLKSGVGKLIAGYHLARGAVSTAAMPGRLAYQHHMQNKMQQGISDSLAAQQQSGMQSGVADAAGKDDKDKKPSDTDDMPNHTYSAMTQGKKGDGKSADSSLNNVKDVKSDSNKDTGGNLYEGGEESRNLEPEMENDKNNTLNGFDPEKGDLNSENDMQRMENDLNNNGGSPVDSVVGDRQVKYTDGKQMNKQQIDMPGNSDNNHTKPSEPLPSGESKADKNVIFSDK